MKISWRIRELLGWHLIKSYTEFDGCSLHGKCIICGKECMRDSQGNWF